MNKIKILDIPKDSKIFITGHLNPDGDALGSGLALKLILDELGLSSTVSYDIKSKISEDYHFLPIELITSVEDLQNEYDISFVFDCGDPDRLGVLSNLVLKSKEIYVIDHHLDPKFGTNRVVDPLAASTTQVLYRILKQENIYINSLVSTCLLTGLITDTGRFQYSNTTAEVFQIGSELMNLGADLVQITESIYSSIASSALLLQAEVINRLKINKDTKISYSYVLQSDYIDYKTTPEDTDFLIDVVRLPRESTVALLLKEQEDGSYKGSLRSRGEINVQLIAAAFGGGGHQAASGFSTNFSRDEILNMVNDAVKSQT